MTSATARISSEQIRAHLSQSLFITPTAAWLDDLTRSQKPTTPLSSLLATAKMRILNSDFTRSLTSAAAIAFPADIHQARLAERRVPGPIAVQVLAVEDLTRSRWEQIEAIEAMERGEGTKGREVVRVVPGAAGDDADNDPTHGASGVRGGGTCKLLLQDTRGTTSWAVELKPVAGLKVGMNIGSKMLLKDVLLARGVLLLEPASVTLLGGKIDAAHKAWIENRKQELRDAITRDAEAGP